MTQMYEDMRYYRDSNNTHFCEEFDCVNKLSNLVIVIKIHEFQ